MGDCLLADKDFLALSHTKLKSKEDVISRGSADSVIRAIKLLANNGYGDMS